MKILKVTHGFFGSLIGAVAGGIKGRKQEKRAREFDATAKELRPQDEDYEQRRFFNTLERRRLGYMTGSGVANARSKIQDAVSSGTDAAVNMGSGGGSDIASILRAGSGAANAFNDLLGKQEEKGLMAAQISEALLGKISQRKLDLQNYDRLVAQGNAERLFQSAEYNKNAALASVVDVGNKVSALFPQFFGGGQSSATAV